MKMPIDLLLEEMILAQKQHLLKIGRQIVPHLVEDDLWQPNDFPKLEQHPIFRYEEGILAGLLSAQTAIRANFIPLGSNQEPLK